MRHSPPPFSRGQTILCVDSHHTITHFFVLIVIVSFGCRFIPHFHTSRFPLVYLCTLSTPDVIQFFTSVIKITPGEYSKEGHGV